MGNAVLYIWTLSKWFNFAILWLRFCVGSQPHFRSAISHCLETAQQYATQIGNCVAFPANDIKRHNANNVRESRLAGISSGNWLVACLFLAVFFASFSVVSLAVRLLPAPSSSAIGRFPFRPQSRLNQLPVKCAAEVKVAANSATSSVAIAIIATIATIAANSLASAAPLSNRNRQRKSKCVNWFRLLYASYSRFVSCCRASLRASA